jgi:hypothetical protein
MAEQNGCKQRLKGYLSCQQRLVLAFPDPGRSPN